MTIKTFRGMNSLQQLMFSVFIVIICFLILMILSLIIAIPVFDLKSVPSIPTLNDLGNPLSVKILKYFQVVQSIGLFIIPPFIIGWLIYGNSYEFLFLNKKPYASSVLLVLLLTIIISPGINFTGTLNSKMAFPEWMSGIEEWMRNAEDSAEKLTEAFLRIETVWGLFFSLFMIAFLPAVGEELLFRGVIQRIFSEWTKNSHWGIWISAFLFSALHLQFYGFLPRLLLGVLFGYLLVWSGTMWLPVIAHFVNNAAAVIAWYLVDKNLVSPEIEDYGATSESFYMAAISLLLAILLLWIIRKQKREEYNVI